MNIGPEHETRAYVLNVLDLLRQNPCMSNTEIANRVSISVSTVQRITRSLHAKLKIRRNPSERNTWIVLDK